jgi:hypothetical protein
MCETSRRNFCPTTVVRDGECSTSDSSCWATDIDNLCTCVSRVKTFEGDASTTLDGVWQCSAPTDVPVCPAGGVINGSPCAVSGETYTSETSGTTVDYASCKADRSICTCRPKDNTIVSVAVGELYPKCSDLSTKWTFTFPTTDAAGSCSAATVKRQSTDGSSGSSDPVFVDGTSLQVACLHETELCYCERGVLTCKVAPETISVVRPTEAAWDCHTIDEVIVPSCDVSVTKGTTCNGPTDATSTSTVSFHCVDTTAGARCSCQRTPTGFQWLCSVDTDIVCADSCCSNLKDTASGDIKTDLCEDVKIEVDVESAEKFDGIDYKVRLAFKYTLTAGTEIPTGLVSELYDLLTKYDVTVTIGVNTVDDKKILTVVLFISQDAIDALGAEDLEAVKSFFTELMNESGTSSLILETDPEVSQYVVEDAIIATSSDTSSASVVVASAAVILGLF